MSREASWRHRVVGYLAGGIMYRYDVFVSYKREASDHALVTPWLREVLIRIEFWLRQELGGQRVNFFFDEDSIEVGEDWPNAIQDALLSAKCLLPIWLPTYFHSSWCLSEWKSFLLREKLIASTKQKSPKLIVPIKFCDGESFPEEAQRVQQLDLSRYTGTTSAFWSTQRADELDQRIKKFSPILARAVTNAPPYDPDWPIEIGKPDGPPTGGGMPRL